MFKQFQEMEEVNWRLVLIKQPGLATSATCNLTGTPFGWMLSRFSH